MASIGHLAAGLVASRAYPHGERGRGRAIIVLCALSLAPDIDVVGFRFGVPYDAPLGHRGATHSLVVAVVLAVIASLFHRRQTFAGFFPLAVAVAASHGVLDAMTNGGHGVAFFWPWATRRFFLDWRFIPVAPIGAGMLSTAGLRVVLSEAVTFSPAWAVALWPLTRTDAPWQLRGGNWRILGAGTTCALLGLGAYQLVYGAFDRAPFVAAPCSMAAGIGAAALLTRVRRHRRVVAPLVGVVATALACLTSISLACAIDASRRSHETFVHASLGAFAAGLYGCGVLSVFIVPWGIGCGYLTGKLAGRRAGAQELAR